MSVNETVVNAAASREALKVIRGMVNEELEDLKDISGEVRADFISIRGWCDHALAAPPRNCDIVPIEAPEAADMFHKERPGHGYDYETHDFNAGFHNLMKSAMAADWYEKHGKPIPRRWKERLDEASDWLNELSAENYDRLIH